MILRVFLFSVNWAALAQQWIAQKEPELVNVDPNWDAASRQKPIFPSATNIVFVSSS